jgi:hypothetical protein
VLFQELDQAARGRTILRIHPAEVTAVRRILSVCLLLAMLGLAGAILLPLMMGLAFK